MNVGPGIPPAQSRPPGDSGAGALLGALEAAPMAIYCFGGPTGEPLWANARARSMGTTRADLPGTAVRSVAAAVDEVLRTGRAETVTGGRDREGAAVTATLRPLPVSGGPGVLLVVEPVDRNALRPAWSAVEAEVVDQVQHSLLPRSLPLLPDLFLSGSYHRASSVHAAGGDWYDAVPLGRGRIALVIGDAVGHGIPAVAAMSRLRGAMRSSALRDPAPSSVLTDLDTFAAQMDDVEGASVFYGVLDASTGRLTYATAGHPAPLIVQPDGGTSFLPVVHRPPLGTLPELPTEALEQDLAQGSTLVLYSDGAVVAPHASPADGLARLAEVARAAVTGLGVLDADASAGLAAAIASGVHLPGGRADDVAVLVAHRCASAVGPLRLDLPAVPASLSTVRRRVGAWLDKLGMGEQDRVGVLVAVGEACANAAEHAYRDTEPGPMDVTGQVDVDGVLTITVRDEGSWRRPDRDPGDRGRGLLIMRQLVDSVLLRGEHGTTVTLRLRLRRGPEAEEELPATDAAATVEVDRHAARTVVRVAGVVDAASAEHMRIRLLEASHGGTGPVELDLTGVGLFSSAAVRVVLAIARIARDEGWRLVVAAPEGGVTRHILEISGLSGLVELR